MVTFWGINYARQMRTERAERVGEALKVVGNAVDTFAVKYHREISEVLADPNKRPSFTVRGITFRKEGGTFDGKVAYLDNLSAENVIRALKLPGVSRTPPPGLGKYAIQIYRTCDFPQLPETCRLDSLTYITEPMKRNYSSAPDFSLAAIAARKIGALGGISTKDDPANFRFIDGPDTTIAVGNPAGLPGLIAVRGGALTDAMDIDVRRDGSLPMTGKLDMKSTGPGGEKRNDIVGVGKLDTQSINVAGDGTIHGGLTLGHDLNLASPKKKSNIVGAGNIEGSGKLSMNSLDVQSADVGALKASESVAISKDATIDGTLRVGSETRRASKQSATIVTGDSVQANSLKSASGIVELKNAVTPGTTCNVRGISRDSAGRVMSCQEVNKQWVWKLSAPRNKDEVPKEIIKEITDTVYRDAQWTITEFDLMPYSWLTMLTRGTTKYVLAGAAGVVFCTLDSQGKPVVDGETIDYQNGVYTISGPTRRRVVCLAQGNNGRKMVMRQTSENPYSSIEIRPAAVISNAGEVNRRLERLTMPTALPPGLVTAQTMLGGRGFRDKGRDTTTRIEGATSCRVDWPRSSIGGYGGAYRFASDFEADTDGTPMLTYSSMDSIWILCKFRTVADAQRSGLKVVVDLA